MEKLRSLLDTLKPKTFEEIKNNCEFDIKESGNLYMLSFNDLNDLNDDLVREVNGIILEKDTNKLVHYAFSKAYDGLSKADGEDPFTGTLDSFRVENLVEGTLIKVFYYDGIWWTGTSRNIDAVYSHWGSEKSFKELFLETCKKEEIDIDVESLDKNFCYSYILQHPEITIGYDITVPDLIPLNKIHLDTLEVTNLMDGFSLGLTLDEVKKQLSFDRNFMIITDDNKRIKMLSDDYKYAKALLNNNPNLKWAYLEALQEGEGGEMRKYFPSKTEIFDYVDEKIHNTVETLHHLYILKFIKHDKESPVPKRLYKTLGQLHGRYKKTREKTTREIIYNHLLSLPVKALFWVLSL